MLYYLYIIPTLILGLTFLIYSVSSKGFRDYAERLEKKVATLEKLSNIVFTKDMLSLFLKNSSLNTQLYFTQRELAEEAGDDTEISDMPMMSVKDMSKLETSLKNALQPSRDLERVKHGSSIIRTLMIIFGVLIAVTEYIVVSSSIFNFGLRYTLQLDGIVFGITIIFSVVLFLILVDIFTTSRKISSAYDNVEKDYGGHKQSTLSID